MRDSGIVSMTCRSGVFLLLPRPTVEQVNPILLVHHLLVRMSEEFVEAGVVDAEGRCPIHDIFGTVLHLEVRRS